MCTCTAHTVQLCLNYISLTYITYVCMYVCYSTIYVHTTYVRTYYILLSNYTHLVLLIVRDSLHIALGSYPKNNENRPVHTYIVP